MDDNTRKEIVRELELDYEKTTQAIEDVGSSSFTIRGWGMTQIAALIGLIFQDTLWPALANRPPPGISSRYRNFSL
jgi:hypothetical protein